MKKLLLLISLFLIGFNGTYAQRKVQCHTCEQSQNLLDEIIETRKSHLNRLKDQQKHNVIYGPTAERKSYEIAQGKAYRFVCNEERGLGNDLERADMMKFVLKLDDLKIDSVMMVDLKNCFRHQVKLNKDSYTSLAKENGLSQKLRDFIK